MNEKEFKVKSIGLIAGIQSFSDSERGGVPSSKFADNYIRILQTIEQHHESIKDAPPPRTDTTLAYQVNDIRIPATVRCWRI